MSVVRTARLSFCFFNISFSNFHPIEAIDVHLPLRISHFQQNGNLKNVTHIDASNNELTSADLEMQIKAISASGADGDGPAPVVALAAVTVLNDQQQKHQQKTQPQNKRRHSAGSMNGTASIDDDDQPPPPPSPTSPALSTDSADSVKHSLNGDRPEKDVGALDNGCTGGESGEPDDKKDEEFQLFKYPSGQTKFRQFSWIITWPIYLLFVFTIPNCEKPRYKKWFPLTFIMCIVWIGSLSYVVAWMITIIGKL